MDTQQDKNTKEKEHKDYKIFAKNYFYSFLQGYSTFFFSIISSFLVARLISQETWGFLILTLSYVSLFQLFLTFLPPSLGLSYNYYIPKYRALNQKRELKSFILNSLYIRITFVVLIYFIGISFYFLFTPIFIVGLKQYNSLFIILSPMIIIHGLNVIFYDIDRAFNKFKIVLILIFLQNVSYITGLVFFFISPSFIQVEFIAFNILVSNLVPFAINCVVVARIIYKLNENKDKSQKLIRTLKKLYSYGIHISIKSYFDGFYRQFRILTIGLVESSESALGFNIANNYNNVIFEAVSSFNKPLTVSFSNLYAKGDNEKILIIYNTAFKFSLFIILLITGILYFASDIFLFIVYGNLFLTYALLLKLMVISIAFNVLSPFFFSFLRASNRVKFLVPISMVNSLIRIIFFWIGLITFGIYGAVILGILVANIVVMTILVFLNKKLLKINLNTLNLFYQYLLFFISLGSTLILEYLIFRPFNSYLSQLLNFPILIHFNLFSLLFFLFSYLTLNLLFNILSNKDLEYINWIFDRDARPHKLIRKVTYLISKLVFRK